MKPQCPYCLKNSEIPKVEPHVVRCGTFYRTSDSRTVQKYRCWVCRRYFSLATFSLCYRQHKRQHNDLLKKNLASGLSLRRSSLIMNLSRTTVARKLVFLAKQARINFEKGLQDHTPSKIIEFDDLETFEHSKYKPVSITLAVEYKTRKILGFATSRMPPRGVTAKAARKKYGPRKDERQKARIDMFERMRPYIDPTVLIKSDQNPHYPDVVKKVFPQAQTKTYRSRRATLTGLGELKVGGFDPIFSLNHTCAMLRANINRLFRRTWCTTKKIERLNDHLAIYVDFHNSVLI